MRSVETLRGRQIAASDRIDYLDVAKGIFIMMIITGHHLHGADSFVRFLYSMSVPSFFMITGFLCESKKEWEQPFGKVFVKKAKKLLYPFVTFSMINLLWHVLYYDVLFHWAVPEYGVPEKLLYTVSTYGYNALWYLPCVLWATLLFFALRRLKHHRLIWVVSAIGLMVFYILFDQKLTGLGLVSYVYCYLLRTTIATVYLYTGSVLYYNFKNMNRVQENLLLLICTVISGIISALYWLYPEQFPIVNLATHRLGNPYIYYLAAISNTLVILLLCKKFLGRSRILAYFGRHSLIPMALHMDVTIGIAWWIFHKLHIDFGEIFNSVIVIGMELLMFPVIITIINRFFPFILTSPTRKSGR